MPITPFHFGPGGLVSAVAPKRHSFLAFCAVNVLIDFESLYNMTTRQPRIHTFFHTYVGASLAGLAVVLGFLLARRFASQHLESTIFSLNSMSTGAITLGALVGAWSHVMLDSIMHGDITPLAPFSERNTLHHIISVATLHWVCLATGAAAIFLAGLRSSLRIERADER